VLGHDSAFVRTLLRDFAGQLVAGAAAHAAVRSLPLEVSEGVGIERVRIEVGDGEAVIGWHPLRGATVLHASDANASLLDANDDDVQESLTRLVVRFLSRHQFIAKGSACRTA
jgi:hypothetical protein